LEITTVDRDSTHALIKRLSEFSERNRKAELFSEEDFVATFNQINPFVRAFPIHFDQFEMLRSRKISNSTDLENVKQMGPPPAHRIKSMGRCNHEGQSVLYGASNLPTSFLEIGFSETEPCAITVQFKLREGQQLRLLPIGELDHYRRHKRPRLGTPGIAEQIEVFLEPLEAYDYFAFHYVDAYLVDYFSRPSDSEPHLYEVTARISNAFMNIIGIDGIIYPSVKHQGGLNYAINPESFEGKFEVVKFSLTTPVRDLGYGLFEFYEHAHGTHINERGDFIWYGNPHFRARMTIPHNAEA
jgi:RES domain-containing protein